MMPAPVVLHLGCDSRVVEQYVSTLGANIKKLNLTDAQARELARELPVVVRSLIYVLPTRIERATTLTCSLDFRLRLESRELLRLACRHKTEAFLSRVRALHIGLVTNVD